MTGKKKSLRKAYMQARLLGLEEDRERTESFVRRYMRSASFDLKPRSKEAPRGERGKRFKPSPFSQT
ncbi:MAG: hypothetical protein H6853_01750 [Rhodospirillales bacterium]|nr:hypothetical protein [Alphaproteobacteria bacterium]USO04026.1 MAG: hypothetical protein H6853_01750 [Rhodospirillales bacterium]